MKVASGEGTFAAELHSGEDSLLRDGRGDTSRNNHICTKKRRTRGGRFLEGRKEISKQKKEGGKYRKGLSRSRVLRALADVGGEKNL